MHDEPCELSNAELLNRFSGAIKNARLSNKWRRTHEAEGLELIRRVPFSRNPGEAFWCLRANITSPPTCVCGKRLSFKGLGAGYAKFCSTSCAAKSGNGLKNVTVHPMLRREVSEKRSKTYTARHGGVGFAGSVNQKARSTMLKTHGASHNWQVDSLKVRYLEERRRLSFQRVQALAPTWNVEALFSEGDYANITAPLPWRCLSCSNDFTSTLIKGAAPRCLVCHPHLSGTSALEQSWFDWVKSLLPTASRRAKVNGVEVDILAGNLAIEINGLYWHSEAAGYSPNRHLEKTRLCAEVGVQLLHFFEDDLNQKPDIIKSMIAGKLGLNQRIFARKCEVVQLASQEANRFFEANHLQGAVRGIEKALGLVYNKEIVQVIAIGRSRFKKEEIELLRACSKLNLTVVGGLSRLIKHLDVQVLYTYVDRTHGTGDSYRKTGWELVGTSGPAQHYFSKQEPWKHNRLQFQKHKLKNFLPTFDPALTEWQNAQANGWNRVWDCGVLKYAFYQDEPGKLPLLTHLWKGKP